MRGFPGCRRLSTSPHGLRRTFALKATVFHRPHLRIFHDEDHEVYLNGRLIASLSGYTEGYSFVPLDTTAVSALGPEPNTIAIHVHQTPGGQFIDAGLVDVGDQSPATDGSETGDRTDDRQTRTARATRAGPWRVSRLHLPRSAAHWGRR